MKTLGRRRVGADCIEHPREIVAEVMKFAAVTACGRAPDADRMRVVRAALASLRDPSQVVRGMRLVAALNALALAALRDAVGRTREAHKGADAFHALDDAYGLAADAAALARWMAAAMWAVTVERETEPRE